MLCKHRIRRIVVSFAVVAIMLASFSQGLSKDLPPAVAKEVFDPTSADAQATAVKPMSVEFKADVPKGALSQPANCYN